jgi:cytochrome c-type biogenesis protein CcmH/NrfG
MASALPLGSSPAAERWMLGRWADLCLGCGLLYLLSLPILVGVAWTTDVRTFPATAIVLITLFLNGPHYGATLLRVYDQREDRRRYAVFAVHVTWMIAVLLVVATWNVWVASLLVTAYVTWSPWHFSGQNYGLMLMFLRRRGVDVDPVSKRLLYASFVLSALLAMLAIHAGREDAVFAPATLRVANVPSVMRLVLPSTMLEAVGGLLLAAYLGCLVVAWRRLASRASGPALVPAFLLVLNQALWFTVPAILAALDALDTMSLVFAAVWVNAAHSVQYLWVTAYYAKRSKAGSTVRGFLGRSLLAGTAVTTIPALLLAPHLLGGLPWDAGLAAVLFSAVNLHHFLLDGAIWKLRDGRVAQVLLRDVPVEPSAGAGAASTGRWPRRIVWTLAVASLVVPLLVIVGFNAVRRATNVRDLDRAVGILRWVGHETTQLHVDLADRFATAQNHQRAIEHYRRSIELFPTGRAWTGLGLQQRALGDWDAALASYEEAERLTPDLFRLPYWRAEALLAVDARSRSRTHREEAIASLVHMLELAPDDAAAARLLARVQAEAGERSAAIDTFEATLGGASTGDREALLAEPAALRP